MNTPKVYFKATHKAWYSNIGPASAKGNRRPVKLVAGPNDKATQKLAVEELWRKLAANGLPEGDAANLESDPFVADLFVAFLDHHKKHSKPGTSSIVGRSKASRDGLATMGTRSFAYRRSKKPCDELAEGSVPQSEQGLPRHIRSDNGPKFIAVAIRRWLGQVDVEALYIEPGSPWEIGYAESFHSRLRDEFLAVEVFENLASARALTIAWKEDYNQYPTAPWATRLSLRSPPRVLLPLLLRLRSSSTREDTNKQPYLFPNPNLHNPWYRKSEPVRATSIATMLPAPPRNRCSGAAKNSRLADGF